MEDWISSATSEKCLWRALAKATGFFKVALKWWHLGYIWMFRLLGETCFIHFQVTLTQKSEYIANWTAKVITLSTGMCSDQNKI